MPRHRTKHDKLPGGSQRRRRRQAKCRRQALTPTCSMSAMLLAQPPPQYSSQNQCPFQPVYGSWYMPVPSPWLAMPAPWAAAPWPAMPAPWPAMPVPWPAMHTIDPPAVAAANPGMEVCVAAPTAIDEAPSGAVARGSMSPNANIASAAVMDCILSPPPRAAPQSPDCSRQRPPLPSYTDYSSDDSDIILISDDEDELLADGEGGDSELKTLPDGILREDFCTICVDTYEEGASFIGILNDCNCYLFSSYCYVCAVQLKELGHKCPRCRSEIKSVSSQMFKKTLLHPDINSDQMLIS